MIFCFRHMTAKIQAFLSGRVIFRQKPQAFHNGHSALLAKNVGLYTASPRPEKTGLWAFRYNPSRRRSNKHKTD